MFAKRIVDVAISDGHDGCSNVAPQPHEMRAPQAQYVIDDVQRAQPAVLEASAPQHEQRPSAPIGGDSITPSASLR
jgi:hypothetical protein